MAIRAGLARVSTDEQAFQVGLSNQVSRLKEAGCERIYVDIASRTDQSREGVAALMRDIKAGEIKEVYVTVLDRASGSPALFDKLSRLMQSKGIPIIGLDQSIDILSDDGAMMADLNTVFAKNEVYKIRSRSQRGHAAKKKHSRANASAPFGYVNQDRGYVLNNTPHLCLLTDKPEHGEFHGRTFADLARDSIAIFFEKKTLTQAIKAIHAKYGIYLISTPRTATVKESKSFILEGDAELSKFLTPRDTKRSLFSWTHKGLRNWLLNPVLRGHTAYNTRELLGTDDSGRRKFGKTLPQELWEIHRDTHPEHALLTEADYKEIKFLLEYSGRTHAKWMMEAKDRKYPVSGLIRCAVCGGRCKSQATKVKKGVSYNYYKCKNAIAGTCDQNKSLRNDRAEAAIIEELIQAAERIEQLRKTEPERAPIVTPEITELKQQLAGLLKLGNNAVILDAAKQLREQIARLEMNDAARIEDKSQREETLVSYIADPDFWSTALKDEEFKMRLFQEMVLAVWLQDGTIERIELKI